MGKSWNDRLSSKVDLTDEAGCWPWLAATDRHGYGVYRQDGRTRRAHRVVYEVLAGPIPEGMTLDHTCRNRACVNPAHLEPMTLGENVLRGVGPTAQNARKITCDAGHPLPPRQPGRQRRCSTCTAAYQRRYMATYQRPARSR